MLYKKDIQRSIAIVRTNAHNKSIRIKSLYNMNQDKEIDRRVNMLLSGLEKILSAITEMRNCASDSHGVGKKELSWTIMLQDYLLIPR